LFSGQTPEEVCQSVTHLNTGEYKLLLADLLIEHFNPVRDKIGYYLKNHDHLDQILVESSSRAEELAGQTMAQVRDVIGLRP